MDNEDYLLQEFHEAGIWLPEELKALEDQMTMRAAARRLSLHSVQYAAGKLYWNLR